jgi:hypothetical protein
MTKSGRSRQFRLTLVMPVLADYLPTKRQKIKEKGAYDRWIMRAQKRLTGL